MSPPASGIRYLPGSVDILTIAPHGPLINGEYQNDIRTGVIAEEIHKILGCSVIINGLYFKPKGIITKDVDNYFLDLFRIDHARKISGYLEKIREIAENEKKTLVLWIHGIADDVAIQQGKLHKEQGLFKGEPSDLQALIGYGQGGDPKTGEDQDRLSARPETVQKFADHLCENGMNTIPTWEKGPNFRGRDSKRLNQWFNQLHLGFERVESIQLEIREKSFRDSEENAIKTAHLIAKALPLTLS